MPSIATTDPKWVPRPRHSPIERIFLPLMRDERDLIFIRRSALMTAILLPMAMVIFLLPPKIIALLAVPYIGFVFLSFGGRFGLMLHAVGHRPIFKRKFRFVQNYIPWVLGPFLGHTPTSFAAHHMWMHHAENNMLGDGSSTLPYQRDRFSHFLHYFFRFFLMGPVHLSRYLSLRGRRRIATRFLLGEAAWYLMAAFALYLNWAAALLVFILPMLMMRWLMMAGNWGQHAFIDLADPDNGFKNSHNLTNTGYNHKAYNDGYHIVHHNKPGMHWTEMAKCYEDNVQDYIDADSVVFDGLADNQAVWFALMTKNYDKLANHLVNFHDRSHEEKIAFLQKRVRETSGEIPSLWKIESAANVEATARRTSITVEQALAAE